MVGANQIVRGVASTVWFTTKECVKPVHKLFNWASIGAIGGAFAGLCARLQDQMPARTIRETVCQTPVVHMLVNALPESISSYTNYTPIRYIPGIFATIISIASVLNSYRTGSSPVSNDPVAKTKRIDTVARSLAMALTAVVATSTNILRVDDLAGNILQGIALYTGAQAAKLYGHDRIATVMRYSSTLIGVISYFQFVQHAYACTVATDTVANLGSAYVATIFVGISAMLISKGTQKIAQFQAQNAKAKTIKYLQSLSFDSAKIPQINGKPNYALYYEDEQIEDAQKLREHANTTLFNSIEALEYLKKTYYNNDPKAFAKAIVEDSPDPLPGLSAKTFLDRLLHLYHDVRALSIEKGHKDRERAFYVATDKEKTFFPNTSTDKSLFRDNWNTFIQNNTDVINLITKGNNNGPANEHFKGKAIYGAYLIPDVRADEEPDAAFTFIPTNAETP